MTIELLTPERAAEAYAIYDDCRNALTAINVLQWTEEYPSAATVENDIRNKELYGYIDQGVCKGLIVPNTHQEPEYETVSWQDTTGKALVIHRLAVSPHHQKQGIAGQLMGFAESFALQNNYTSIRLDTYSGNKGSLALYLNRGYESRGQIHFKGRVLPFFCMEKWV